MFLVPDAGKVTTVHGRLRTVLLDGTSPQAPTSPRGVYLKVAEPDEVTPAPGLGENHDAVEYYTITDANGNFSFPGVLAGRSYAAFGSLISGRLTEHDYRFSLDASGLASTTTLPDMDNPRSGEKGIVGIVYREVDPDEVAFPNTTNRKPHLAGVVLEFIDINENPVGEVTTNDYGHFFVPDALVPAGANRLRIILGATPWLADYAFHNTDSQTLTWIPVQ